MSFHPAGVRNPLQPFRKGPPAPLYRSGIVAPTRSVAFLVEMQVDQVSTETKKVATFQVGVHTGMYRRRKTVVRLTPETRRFATIPLITSQDEVPANVPIDGRLRPIRIDRALDVVDGRFAPLGRAVMGQIDISNLDGALDQLDADRVVVGRPITARVGTYRIDSDGRTARPDGVKILDVLAVDAATTLDLEDGTSLALDSGESIGVLSAFGTIFSGVVETVAWQRDTAQVTARDPRYVLERPVQRSTYSGSGGLGGTAAIAGMRKPKAFGFCRNVPLQLIDPVLGIWQYHDGEARGVVVLRGGGLEIARHAVVRSFQELTDLEPPSEDSVGEIPLGTFVDCPWAGCLRLGGAYDGTLTADVRGAGYANSLREAFSDGTLFTDGTGWRSAATAVHSRTATDVTLRLFEEVAGDEVEVAGDQIRQFGTEYPYEVGLYLEPGGQASLDQCLALLADSLGAVMFRSKSGTYQFRALREPNEVPVLTIRPDMILPDTLQRLNLPYRQPWADWEIECSRNHHPMGDSEFVEAVSPEDRQRLSRDVLVVRSVNTVAATVYPERAPIRVTTALSSDGDAAKVGGRLAAFYAPGRVAVELRVKGIGYRLDLLQTVRVIHPRYRLGQGRNMVVTAVSEDGAARNTYLKLFG